MTDISELTEYVKNHGTDHEARWKLSKKLYDEGEYERAVYHLEIVRQYKVDSPNVVRYLAASYYRLNRYDDAVAELRSAIKRWPDETGLREQLGRVLHVAGRLEESLETWRDIVRIEPGHSTAGKMVARSEREIAASVKREPEPLRDSELGLGQAEGRICPTCGAVNTEEFERCWKCHSSLVINGVMAAMDFMESVTPTPPAPPARTAPRPDPAELWNLIAGIAAGTIALASLFFALTHMSGSDEATAALTVRELLQAKLLIPRLLLGSALLVWWPLAIWLALLLVKCDVVPWPTIAVTGALMAAGMFASFQLPPQYLMYLLGLILLAGAAPILLLFRLGTLRGALVWLIQAVLVTAVFLATAMAMQGVSCVADWPAVARYAAAHDDVANGEYRLDDVRIPQQWTLRWESSGSKWLDELAQDVVFEMEAAEASMELKEGTRTLYFIKPPDKAFRHSIVPGRSYELLLSGPDGAEVDVRIRGLLSPKVGG